MTSKARDHMLHIMLLIFLPRCVCHSLCYILCLLEIPLPSFCSM